MTNLLNVQKQVIDYDCLPFLKTFNYVYIRSGNIFSNLLLIYSLKCNNSICILINYILFYSLSLKLKMIFSIIANNNFATPKSIELFTLNNHLISEFK